MLFLTPVPRRCALNFGSTFSAWPIGLGVAGRVATDSCFEKSDNTQILLSRTHLCLLHFNLSNKRCKSPGDPTTLEINSMNIKRDKGCYVRPH